MTRPLILLPPNRVRRNYQGGALLDRFEGITPAIDSDRPEDWIASTTPAKNPGLPAISGEGLAMVINEQGGVCRLTDLISADPDFYLGKFHLQSFGLELGFLAKLLDASMRLHLQAHPTAAFAQRHLGSRWGKLEAYVILDVRPGFDSFVRLGFQRPPSAEEWKRIVLTQDIAAMDACFDPVPVRPGEVWLIPGGIPHAIGPGVMMLEVMEPSDLVVRCEFEREGILVPPEARFMGVGPDLALQIFDYSAVPISEAQRRFRIPPRQISETETLLIGPEHTESFRISRFTCQAPLLFPPADRIRIAVVTRGFGSASAGGMQIPIRPGSKFLIAAASPACTLTPDRDEQLELLVCWPNFPAGSN